MPEKSNSLQEAPKLIKYADLLLQTTLYKRNNSCA